MAQDRGNRGEKLSAFKSTAVQYGILMMMLALAAGVWRLQVLGASNFRELAQQNRIRKVPILAPRGKLFDRENRLIVDNYPSVSCFLVREQNKQLDADLPHDRAGAAPGPRPAQGHAAALSRGAGLPAHPHQAGHHGRRTGVC